MSFSPYPRHRWIDRSTGVPAETAQTLAAALKLPLPIARTLVARGLDTPQRAEAFLRPRLGDLTPLEDIPGLLDAAARIHAHIRAGHAVLVFGDYDADGITASSVLLLALRALKADVTVFLPDRVTEGYGFTEAAVRRALDEHPATRLIVTVDCGSTQLQGCAVAAGRGVEVIITDHHDLADPLPETVPGTSVSVHVNPGKPGFPEASAHLCGVGLAFKLAHALARSPTGGTHVFDIRPLLPLVALGTVADIVPLVGENRILVFFGLLRINQGNALPGILALARAAGLLRGGAAPLTTQDISFKLAPRINATGRIGNPYTALELLTSTNPVAAQRLAAALNESNERRRELEQDSVREAERQAAEYFAAKPDAKALVVASPRWHPGIIGLIAGRLNQHYGLPTIAFQIDSRTGSARGSSRASDAGGFVLTDILGVASRGRLKFGGHAAAAGMTLADARDLAAFASDFEAACADFFASHPGIAGVSELGVDGWLAPEDITDDFHKAESMLEPCGQGNPVPCWGLRNAVFASPPRTTNTGLHLRFSFRTAEDTVLPGVMFSPDPATLPKPGADGLPGRATFFDGISALDIVFTLSVNTFGVVPELQAYISDFEASR